MGAREGGKLQGIFTNQPFTNRPLPFHKPALALETLVLQITTYSEHV